MAPLRQRLIWPMAQDPERRKKEGKQWTARLVWILKLHLPATGKRGNEELPIAEFKV